MAEARTMRTDARRNQEQILLAAREVFVEHGAGAPLEDVASRAGVGIGTLYRRFADRRSLLRAVVLDALEHSRAAAEQARGETGDRAGGGTDGLERLGRYMHAVLDLRVSAVVPLALDRLDLDDADLGPAREASARAVQALVDEAHDDGSLPAEVTFGDVGTLLVRLSRPLPGPVPPTVNDELAHRHLTLVLAGLRAAPGTLVDQGLSRAQLASLGDGSDESPGATAQARKIR